MKISVVICTHNRADSLKRTLTSLTTQTLSPDDFEVLVVDNASTDHTAKVVDTFSNLPVRYVYEPTLGLSVARNTGWRSARGAYVAFLDDDAIPVPEWLAAIVHAATARPGVDICLAGRSLVSVSQERPSWLGDRLMVYFGELDLGDHTHILNETPHFALGCNMTFPRAVLKKYGGFSPALGRIATQLRSGEEVLLQKQILATGGLIVYLPDALVYHHIDASRLTRRWLLKRRFWEGVSMIEVARLNTETVSLWNECYRLLDSLFSYRLFTSFTLSRWSEVTEKLGRVIGAARAHREE